MASSPGAPALTIRGGSLLPSGYLSTQGSQIVDAAGNPVRLDSVGWYGTDGPAGAALQGLWTTSYGDILDSIKEDGFNTVRIPWSNADLHTPFAGTNALGGVDWTKNADLKGLTTLQAFQKIVDYAGQIGLKIVFDHHTDDGSGGQQPNGSWIDKGPGTDGTDGAGVQGTVDAARFQADWVEFAKTFAGNSTVIGFDLDNEPTSHGATWGGGGANDIQKMYTDVGNAIQAVDPGKLIIAEGPGTYDGVGYPMDFSGVKTNPVSLNTPNKVVYSPHGYPNEISGGSVDSGQAAIDAMNKQWGWIVKDGIAPVWIGEMGSNMTSDDSKAWASTLLDYMNGKDGAQGGLTFTGNQQPLGGDWWNIGSEGGGGNPDGNQYGWGTSAGFKPEQQAVTDQMVFKPTAATSGASAASTPSPSAPAATAVPTTATIAPATTQQPPASTSTAMSIATAPTFQAAGAAATSGSGPDTLVLNLSEDAYQGDAQFTFSVDGKQVGAEQAVAASHGAGQSQAFTFQGDWGTGTHEFGVAFTNDKWDGTDATDRNLYVDGATFDGNKVQDATPLYSNSTVTFDAGASVAPASSNVSPAASGTGPDTLTLSLSEDAWQGDAQFNVSIDGVALNVADVVTALHKHGQSQDFTFKGDWGAGNNGNHDVAVTFLNDAYGGSAGSDRNLYVDKVNLNGSTAGGTALYTIGTVHF